MMPGPALWQRPVRAAVAASVILWGVAAQYGTIELCGGPGNFAAGAPSWTDTLNEFHKVTPVTVLQSQHVLIFAPASAPLQLGGKVAVTAYKSLPPAHGPVTTAMTKVVLVGHSFTDGVDGIAVGAEACNEHLVDKEAVKWFKEFVHRPTVVSTKIAANPTLDQQMPYLSAIFDERNETDGSVLVKKIDGNLLPIMIGKQSLQLASELGEALTLLVGPEGIWKDERVLFVFSGDMSHKMIKIEAKPNDLEMANLVCQGGFGPAATKISQLKSEDTGSGENLFTKAPFGYAPLLAAAKLADNLHYRGAPMVISNSGEYGPGTLTNGQDPVNGYVSISWVGNNLTPGQMRALRPGPNTLPPGTTTTTTETTTSSILTEADLTAPPPQAVGVAPGFRDPAGFLFLSEIRPLLF